MRKKRQRSKKKANNFEEIKEEKKEAFLNNFLTLKPELK